MFFCKACPHPAIKMPCLKTSEDESWSDNLFVLFFACKSNKKAWIDKVIAHKKCGVQFFLS